MMATLDRAMASTPTQSETVMTISFSGNLPRALVCYAACFGAVQAQAPFMPPAVPTTKILALGHMVKGADRAAIMPVMNDEVPATLKLYLDGTIDQFFFRNDGGGVVFLLNVKTVDEARAIVEKLPLGQHHLMEFDLIPVGPLAPLYRLPQPPTAAQ
jgi:uncharacterized glyoxalase superfamily protein PhnB